MTIKQSILVAYDGPENRIHFSSFILDFYFLLFCGSKRVVVSHDGNYNQQFKGPRCLEKMRIYQEVWSRGFELVGRPPLDQIRKFLKMLKEDGEPCDLELLCMVANDLAKVLLEWR